MDSLQQSIVALEKHMASNEQSLKKDRLADQRQRLNEMLERKRMIETKKEYYKLIIEKNEDFKHNSVAFVSFECQSQMKAVSACDTNLRTFAWVVSKAMPCLFKRKIHLVVQAPEPDDIKWKFIGYSLLRRSLSFFVSFTVMLVVLSLSFFAQMSIQILKNKQLQSLAKENPTTWRIVLGRVIGISSGVFVSVSNILLVTLSMKLSRYEKHLSHSMFILSHTKKLVLLQFINSACIAVALTYLPERLGRLDNLAGYIFTNEVNNLLLGPLLYAFDPEHLISLMQQNSLKKQLERKELTDLSQKDLNELFEPADMMIYLRYCSVIRTFFVSCFFFYVLPFNMIVCAVFLVTQYWMDRYMILRRYKRATRYHHFLSFDLAKFSEVGLLLLCLSNILFKNQEGRYDRFIDMGCLVISVFLLFFPLFEKVQRTETVLDSKTTDAKDMQQLQSARNT